jgi:rfaE bifunctional protein nucleotidyltransferase chain/domain
VSCALTLAEATRRAADLRAAGKTVVMANGVFDLRHVGHLRYLEDAKARGDALLVAVNADASARALKGEGRPIVPEAERLELVAALACVDGAFLFEGRDVREVLRALKPHFHAKGTDYSADTVPEREVLAEWGGEVVITGDPKDHSSTATIAKLKP